MPAPPFQFDPLSTYDVLSEEPDIVGSGRLVAGHLFISRHGAVDMARSIGEVRGHVLYMVGTTIPIGRLQDNQLILVRTGAMFTLSLRLG